jgi:hypothetical protein
MGHMAPCLTWWTRKVTRVTGIVSCPGSSTFSPAAIVVACVVLYNMCSSKGNCGRLCLLVMCWNACGAQCA